MTPRTREVLRSASIRTATAVLATLLNGSLALAADKELNPAGVLHSVIVETRPTGSNPGGTKIVHRVQSADGHIDTYTIPSTDEPTSDIEAALSLSPSTGLPALVWSRLEGADFEINVDLFDGTRWNTPRAITSNALDDRHPQIVWGPSGYMHLLWGAGTLPDGSPNLYESVLDSRGATVLPAARVRINPGTTLTMSMTTTPPPTFREDENLFIVDSSVKPISQVTAYGGYDEPVPVVHRIDMSLPSGCPPIERPRIEVVDHTVVVFVKAGQRLYYAIQLPAGWTPVRAINLESFGSDQAELLVKSMIRKNLTP